MQRLLIAVVNARHRIEWRKAVRSTWLPQVPKDKADALFFVGRGGYLEDAKDIVELNCSDAYEHLPEKVQCIVQWALTHGYSYVLKCDDDVVLRPNALVSSGYEQHDFSGRSGRNPQPYEVPFGFCYFLSSQCMGVVATSKLPADGSNDDEKWVARNLWEHGINLYNDRRFVLHQELLPEDDRRSLRLPKQSVEKDRPFAWCIHLAAEQDVKVREFKKVFERHKEL